MKRGFLNTSKAKKAVEEAYAPDSACENRKPAREPDPAGNVTAANGGVGNGEPVDDPMSDIEETSALDPTSHSANRKGKGKGKEKENAKEDEDEFGISIDPDRHGKIPGQDLTFPIRPPPGRPGWGYHPLEEELHRVPHRGLKRRGVFCQWPRDPKGKPIIPSREKSEAKLSPDGFPWGATLYDFFWVQRVADNPHMLSVMTSSQILHAMKKLGELTATDDAVKWAESEPDPRNESFPMGGVLLEDRELMVKRGFLNKFSARDDVRNAPQHGIVAIFDEDPNTRPRSEDKGKDEDEESAEEDEENAEEDENTEEDEENMEEDEENMDEDEDEEIEEEDQQTAKQSGAAGSATTAASKVPGVLSLLDIPITSPFHPSHYPPPWPMIPFSGKLTNDLQDRIPLYLLPQTLHVHDPFGLLPVVEVTTMDTSWTSRTDVIRTYKLSLIDSALKGVKEARCKAEAVEEFKARTLIVMRFARTQSQRDNFEPVIEVPLPPYPKRPTKIEESHFYLSPAAKVGTGHHSVVYNAEWELPRELFVKPKICAECFQEALEDEKKQLKDTGRWDRTLKAAGWGPKGFSGAIPTQEDSDGLNDPPIFAEGEIIEREVTCVVPSGATPMEVIERLDDRGYWDFFLQKKDRNTFLIQFTEDEVYPDTPPKDHPPPVLRVNPSFSYYDASHADTLCSHLSGTLVPRTAKFSVVAKLSIQHDAHLGVEAENYQRFPDHFFQHWSGYTVISQLHTIVPVRAIVPQFYGYYTPKPGQAGNKRYLSPILLVEHCGKPITPDELSISDKEECASLLLRFQRSGWLHDSVYARNILVQKGLPTLYPLRRMVSNDLSFRLIDFGRSRRFIRASEKQEEELDVLRLFSDLAGTMNVTLGRY